ncbi:MAG: hypothetical protein IJC68_00210 [Firmicutes bacterium]|nr:hypothetical protein [Bacillota bacterium]
MTPAYILGILLFLLAAFLLKRTQNKVEKRMFGDIDTENRNGVSAFDRLDQAEQFGKTDAEQMASPAARRAAAMAAQAEATGSETPAAEISEDLTAEEKVAAAEEAARKAEREAAEKFAAETAVDEEDW